MIGTKLNNSFLLRNEFVSKRDKFVPFIEICHCLSPSESPERDLDDKFSQV
jgi:hypothetical protein